jgi:hypothetical protein
MRSLLFILSITLFPSLSKADTASLVGHWQFYKKVFQGQEMPEPPTATLHLHFEFTADGESSLYWWHESDGDHCARKGHYVVDGEVLRDEITWVDPKNTRDCSDDVDMQLGRKTSTPFFFSGPDLAIRFQLDGEPLDMVWKKIDSREK